jgi:uncharacterized membrane protein YphA (DoxX/SURF4 family)
MTLLLAFLVCLIPSSQVQPRTWYDKLGDILCPLVLLAGLFCDILAIVFGYVCLIGYLIP